MNNKIIAFLSLVIVALLALILLSGTKQEMKPAQILSIQDRETLEVEKQRLEVLKLNNEINSISFSPIIQAGTLSAALIAAAISFWSAWRSQKNQIMIIKAQADQQQKNHISNLLKELGSEQIPVKISAILALSEYESALPYLVNLLRIDNDSRVLLPIETALLQYPEVALKQVLEVNKTINTQRMDLAGKFFSLEYSRDEICELLSVDKSSLEKSLKESRFFQLSRKFKANFKEKCSDNQDTESIRKAEIHSLLEEKREIMNALENTQKSIEKLINKHSLSETPFSIEGASLEGVILSRLNLSNWSFKSCDLRGVYFSDTNCKGTTFTGSNISRGSFTNANLVSSNIDDSILEKTSFSKADCTNASISNSNCNYSNFNGSNLQSANLSKSTFFEGEFHEATLIASNLQRCKIYKAKFISSDFSESDCDNSYWGETVIKGTKATRATFRKAKIEGVPLKNSDFDGADFSQAKFSSISDFEQCSFIGIKLDEAVFSKDTVAFKEFLTKQI